MARGLFITGFTVAEVLAIQQRAKEMLLEGKTIMNWNDADTSVGKQFSMPVDQVLVCRGMDVDGEYIVHKARDAEGEPRIQLIESHRIGDAFGSQATLDGVGVDGWGAPVFLQRSSATNRASSAPTNCF